MIQISYVRRRVLCHANITHAYFIQISHIHKQVLRQINITHTQTGLTQYNIHPHTDSHYFIEMSHTDRPYFIEMSHAGLTPFKCHA